MLQIKMETCDAAFADNLEGAEAARILREVADKIEHQGKLSESCRPGQSKRRKINAPGTKRP